MKTFSRIFGSTLALIIGPTVACAQGGYPLRASLSPAPTVPQAQAEYGKSVAASESYVVVGAPDTVLGGSVWSGAVLVSEAGTGAPVATLRAPAGATSPQFGWAVAVSGTRVVVGTFEGDTGLQYSGSAYVYDLASPTPDAPVAILNNPTPVAGDKFGYSVAIAGNHVVIGAFQDDTGASNAGSAYVYDLASATPTIPVATLDNPSPAVDDVFGISVAVTGNRVVVGAFNDDTGATNAGSAYLYDLESATPSVPVLTFNNPAPASDDNFGTSVFASGDRVVVGAELDDFGAANAGSVYVYDLAGATPAVPVATLHNPSPASGDEFGFSVVISGQRVVVGAYSDNTGATDAGSAYVFDLGSAMPSVPVAILNNPTPANGDFFGESVAVAGSRVVVGAALDDSGSANAGAAYLYDLGGGPPLATLYNPTPPRMDLFGLAVAAAGNLVVVGADQVDLGATDAGAVYVFDLGGALPAAPVAILPNPTPASSDFFGFSVAVSGARVVVGAAEDNTGASNAGSAYVFDLSSATPTTPVATFNNPTPAVNDFFATSVSVSGTRLVIGAYQDDTGATNAGSAYVYDLESATPAVPVHVLNNPSPAVGDFFGYALAVSGDRVVVTVERDDTGATDAGAAYVYDLASATPTIPAATLNNPSPAFFDRFGFSVAMSGSRIVVGAPQDDTGANDAGSAYVYDLASATPSVPVAIFNNPSPLATEYFGNTVAISGHIVVVGSFAAIHAGASTGAAYVYDLTSATPSVPVATLNNPTPAAQDFFGYAVAVAGQTVVVGTPQDDTLNTNEGAAYVFGPTDGDGDGLLDTWEVAHFGATVGHSALDDFDGDGRNELLELAFGGNPRAPDAAATPAAFEEGGFLTITLTKRAGVSLEVQTAADPDGVSFSTVSTTTLLDNATTLKVRDNFPIATTPQRLLRVQVTAAP